MRKILLATIAAIAATSAQAQTPLRPDQAAFRELYEELVETNTAFSNGSCTLAAERLATRMMAAGYTKDEVQVIKTPGHDREGNLVATLKGSSKKLKPMLLLAHIDVVEAKREDWTRDPFTLIEEDGFFFGRGVIDDKAQAAMWVDSLIRFKKDGFTPKRTIKLAANCGEESSEGVLNGAEWLARNRPELLQAEFALNEGGGGRLDPSGKPQLLAMQVGEKATRTFDLEVTNPGGHSSVPRPDNAINELALALTAISKHRFPIMLNDTTRGFLTQYAASSPPEVAKLMLALVADEKNEQAGTMLSSDPIMNSTLRTACVATMLSGGHAANALPQRARATINCRIVPGMSTETVQSELARVIANPKVSITLRTPHRPMAVSPPLDPRIMEPAKQLGMKMFPGVPLIPIMSTGATDATMTGIIGIPTYGVPGIMMEADGGGMHGLNERIRVKSVYEGRDYLHELVKLISAR
jgi:acetylornithine deacetylase/succinyl-diaminopimelate desuccinylase-like protein